MKYKKYSVICGLFLCIFSLNIIAADKTETTSVSDKETIENAEVIINKYMVKNFSDMKTIYASIVNFGAGQEQINTLMTDYSMAFAYKLQNRFDESAKLFKKNHNDITKVANDLALNYQTYTDNLQKETLKMHMFQKFEKSRKSNSLDGSMDMYSSGDIYITNATESLTTAKQLLDNGHPVEAIFHYRRAKNFCFLCYKLYNKPLPKNYEKHNADNKNLVYEKSKEK